MDLAACSSLFKSLDPTRDENTEPLRQEAYALLRRDSLRRIE